MGLFKSFVSQTRKPEGLLGKMILHTCLQSLRKRQWIWAAAADGTPESC